MWPRSQFFLGDGAKRKEMFKQIAVTEPNDELTALLTECDVDDNDNDNNEEDEDEDDNVEGNLEVDHGLRKSNKAILRGAKKKTVPKLCPTRCSSRVETLSALIAKYLSVIETLEQIRRPKQRGAKKQCPIIHSPNGISRLHHSTCGSVHYEFYSSSHQNTAG